LLINTSKVEVKSNIAQKQEEKPADVKKMYNEYIIPTKEPLFLGIDPKINIFLIDLEKHEKIEYPKEMYGHFYMKDAFIIQHIYKKSNDGKEFNTIYFWQGRDTKNQAKGTSAYKTVELSDAVENSKHCRIEQGKEPLDFIQLFKNKLIIHKGIIIKFKHRYLFIKLTKVLFIIKFKGSFNNENRKFGNFFEVRGDIESKYKDSSYAVELESLHSIYFNSNSCYILNDNSITYNWYGLHSTISEIKSTNNLSKMLSNNDKIIEIQEGNESEDFKKLLNWDYGYCNFENQKKTLKYSKNTHVYIPKLFLVQDYIHGIPEVTHIYDFNKSDLESNWIYLLDCKTTIFVWVGSNSKNVKKFALQSVTNYAKLVEEIENIKPEILMVDENNEPLEFSCNFFSWKPYNIKKLNIPKLDQLKKGDDILQQLSTKFYSIKTLKSKIIEGVDYSKLEEYLEDTEFESTFGMTREKFNSLQNWKKEELKKKLDLF
jgi:gelsolin